MSHYYKLGSIPHKRHTQFFKPNGELYSEQLFSTEGFSDDYSLLYHCHPPTIITNTDDPIDVSPKVAEEKMLKHRSFEGFSVKPEKDYLQSRKPVLVNSDCHIVLAAPQSSMDDYYYKNAIVIPRGTIYQITFNDENNRLFIVESFTPLRFPKRYMSHYGQLMEHSPFCERDIRTPQNLQTIDEKGDFLIKTKKKGILYGLHYGTHPFDVIGWDGCCYPYIFSIHDFEPITGRVHQPPPVHQTFETSTFVVCSFNWPPAFICIDITASVAVNNFFV